MLTLKEQLLSVANAFAHGRGLSLSRVSTMVFGDGKVISRLLDGSDLTTARFEAAMLWFSDNWPEGVVWPSQVLRPGAAA